mmetsp:Transcript_3042/g.13151  ORF Transcript_3042/g.13151 Transcript_3042/m.13151 type:complete len:507 (+) Transcript_3042:344-1864(+)
MDGKKCVISMFVTEANGYWSYTRRRPLLATRVVRGGGGGGTVRRVGPSARGGDRRQTRTRRRTVSHVRPPAPPFQVIRRLLSARVVAHRLGLPRPLRDDRGGKLGREYLHLLALGLRRLARLLGEQTLEILDGQIRQPSHHGVRPLQLVPRLPAEEKHALGAALHARLRHGRVVPEHDAPLRGPTHRGARSLDGQRIGEPVADVLSRHHVGLSGGRVRVFEVPHHPQRVQRDAQLGEPLLAVHDRHRHVRALEQLQELLDAGLKFVRRAALRDDRLEDLDALLVVPPHLHGIPRPPQLAGDEILGFHGVAVLQDHLRGRRVVVPLREFHPRLAVLLLPALDQHPLQVEDASEPGGGEHHLADERVGERGVVCDADGREVGFGRAALLHRGHGVGDGRWPAPAGARGSPAGLVHVEVRAHRGAAVEARGLHRARGARERRRGRPRGMRRSAPGGGLAVRKSPSGGGGGGGGRGRTLRRPAAGRDRRASSHRGRHVRRRRCSPTLPSV